MLTSNFNYNLPDHLIAHEPIEPRDHSKLMVVNRETGETDHRQFFDIIEYLTPGDVLVVNNSKVFKARLFGTLVSPTGVLLDDRPPVEIFLVRPMENRGVWRALGYKGKRIKPGMKIVFAEREDEAPFVCDVLLKEEDGSFLLDFGLDEVDVRHLANTYGVIPLPEYIQNEHIDLETYQTTYANDKSIGSVAAPTAGFHFTEDLLNRIKAKGIEVVEITLHVGLGTFVPVKTEEIDEHQMHSEWVEVSEEAAKAINAGKARNARIIAVGTTSVRTLEGIAQMAKITNHKSRIKKFFQKKVVRDTCPVIHAYTGDVNMFIRPGYEFQVVDALITNFHLPYTTLLMLVSAFVGNTNSTLQYYQQAIDHEYRFYSFGDAMFIY